MQLSFSRNAIVVQYITRALTNLHTQDLDEMVEKLVTNIVTKSIHTAIAPVTTEEHVFTKYTPSTYGPTSTSCCNALGIFHMRL